MQILSVPKISHHIRLTDETNLIVLTFMPDVNFTLSNIKLLNTRDFFPEYQTVFYITVEYLCFI